MRDARISFRCSDCEHAILTLLDSDLSSYKETTWIGKVGDHIIGDASCDVCGATFNVELIIFKR